jgi:hypothetical protein
MSSPAQRHRERMLAKLAATEAGDNGAAQPTGSAYELMLAKLAEDKRALKGIQSIQKKIELKRQRLPEYSAWIEGRLMAETLAQDDVLATVLIWRIDTGDIDGALNIAEPMLANGLKLPEHYQRDLATAVVEEIADRATGADGGNVTAADLLRVAALTDGCDMPDEVRSKLHKALGLALREQSPAQALEHLQRALQLNARAGVKQEIAKLEKQLADPAKTPPAN